MEYLFTELPNAAQEDIEMFPDLKAYRSIDAILKNALQPLPHKVEVFYCKNELLLNQTNRGHFTFFLAVGILTLMVDPLLDHIVKKC